MEQQLSPVVKNLLLINTLVFIAKLFHFSFLTILPLRYFSSESFYPFQLVTYMFDHSTFIHFISNMLGLLFLGPLLEYIWGSNKFLLFYLVCGIGAGLVHQSIQFYQLQGMTAAFDSYVTHPNADLFAQFLRDHADNFYSQSEVLKFINSFADSPTSVQYITDSINILKSVILSHINSPMLGASGAIFGILMATAMLFPNREVILFPIPIPVKVKYFVLVYGLYELYKGLTDSGDNVAHFAHLGGMLFAFIMISYWKKDRNSFY